MDPTLDLTRSDERAPTQTDLIDRPDLIEPTDANGQTQRQRFRALAVIAIAQLMIVVDATVVTIALLSAQRALHISVADRQWVMTAYTLAFGGLLLLGGRIADYVGRKRIFILSLLGFAAASALGGLAQSSAMLFTARALQGAMAALMAPAALSLITVTFTETKERARAFGVYGAISGGGAALGLILGGVLTEFVSWRWTLLVNAPIAVLAALAATRTVIESRAERGSSYDVTGALTSTAGLVAVVYGFTRAGTDGWGSAVPLALIAAGAALLAVFAAVELRSRGPLLPMRVITDRNRGGSFVAALLMGIAMFATFLFLSYYFQQTLDYSAVRSGFAFLPFSVGIIIGATFASRVLPRVGPRMLMFGGLAVGTIGLAILTQVGPHSEYFLHIMPAELIISLGMGTAFVPMNSTALIGVDPADAGVASALVNTTQQTGGSLGVALLNTVAATATTHYLVGRPANAAVRAAASVHGYTTSFTVSAGLLAAAAAISLVMLRAGAQDLPADLEVIPAT